MIAKRLRGKVAVVTGANRGIGRGTALCLAEEGADVLVNYRTHAEEAAEVVKEIEALGRHGLAWQADVADRGQIDAMIQGAMKHFGRLDIAVANAAYNVCRPVVDARWEDVERTIAVTQFGVFHTCQLAAQRMVEQGQGGKIIVISSIHAEFPFASSGPYNMAKAAVNHLARTLGAELAQHHINVNVINPGWIDTPGERERVSEEELRQAARNIPWKRLGTAHEIGRCVVFLTSQDADYITGSCLTVDGGFLLGMDLPQSDGEA